MTSIMRKTVRGAAAGLGALAIVAGTAACGGLLGGDEGEDGPSVEEQDPAEDEAEDEGEAGTDEGADPAVGEDGGEQAGTSEGDDAGTADEGEDSTEADTEDAEGADDAEGTDGGEDAAGALSDEDLTAVGDRYYEFLEYTATSDGSSACGMILNPHTEEPIEGTALEQCAEGFESEAESTGVDPSMLDSVERSMFEGIDNGDGTAGVSMMGSDAGVTFLQGDDGEWYIDGSDFV